MGKKDKDSRNKFSETIDPRFTLIFQNSNNINASNSLPERSVFQKETSDSDQDFRDFLSKQLFDYLESRIKIVDVPAENLDLYQFETKEVPLILGAPVLDEDKTEKTGTTSSHPKKKRKKEKKSEKERFKEVAVTADWLEKQAKLFNS